MKHRQSGREVLPRIMRLYTFMKIQIFHIMDGRYTLTSEVSKKDRFIINTIQVNNLYLIIFSSLEYKNSSDTVKKVKAVELILKNYSDISSFLTLANLEAGMTFNIDFNNLFNDDTFLNGWSNFKSDIQEKPIYTINCIKLAIHQVNVVSEESISLLCI